MAEVTFSARAYCKIILHAAKYPHCAINGLLLAKEKTKSDGKSSGLIIEDAIPLFHLCLHVSPMAEIALILVDQYAARQGLYIVGYYLANEHVNDTSTHRPAHRMADKIAENCSNAVLAVIDNRELSLNMSNIPLIVSQHVDGKWKAKDKSDVLLDDDEVVKQSICELLKFEEHRNLIDFDNYLDNISLNWKNTNLNKTIDRLVVSNKSSSEEQSD